MPKSFPHSNGNGFSVVRSCFQAEVSARVFSPEKGGDPLCLGFRRSTTGEFAFACQQQCRSVRASSGSILYHLTDFGEALSVRCRKASRRRGLRAASVSPER